MIDFDFQGFINNKYIIKAKENGFSILVEADTLEEAQNIAEQKLTELKKHKLEVTEETFKELFGDNYKSFFEDTK